ncbi:tRNA (adenosine(37)-N6)-threonylcarbamoyltransferase complex ATPase subunit type 1 TsaE [Rhizobium oryziradicis]|uniref:tRNA threonylcarbamoyladenosine biosynthesis protein TsaE n=1 Tax=Rhizobium oryziradicis TaxID=1867956 RepID=A0A1Q8ZLG5_9HYPH|nr:tRNA (adenosine(37)-N6)-threonylcarbamoyltransferase complex ATPase subunit type 1 TsaE [Rhizobium oryziradicis]OLP42592.1 tRNA (adenosine(37)-N6)-threonylcarbamoyltransferase complex ATPase subunit type 1 TsaE [Rhizobium oryziradicis]
MTTAPSLITLNLADEAATKQLGQDLALAVKPGDCLALHGDLGAGKSTLARALLRALAEDEGLEVPSPTFTLVQSYDLRIPASHFDLYRLGDASELDELGFDEALESGICLVEWPERAQDRLPKDTISIAYSFSADGGRTLTITGLESKLSRIQRSLNIRNFLDTNGLSEAIRLHLAGDASMRAYETIAVPGRPPMILMDAAKRPNGPPIRDGKPYSQIVHLAEDVYPFVAIGEMLKTKGLAAPAIFERDLDQGILLIEDMGRDGVLDESGQPIAERYQAAVSCLAHIHTLDIPREISVTERYIHRIPDFDRVAMKMEAELLIDWHIPWKLGREATAEERADYLSIWDGLIDQLKTAETSLVLRDFHSPNIIWRGDKTGVDRVGLIDFQDAMIGPAAYDLASLAQDARVTIERPLMDALMERYISDRHTHGDFDEARFRRDFAIMAAQRNCKLAGLWFRLLKRDGKPGYMRHMPRTLTYLSIAFEHPALATLRDWCAKLGLLH